MNDIDIQPVARVVNSVDDPLNMPPGGVDSIIEVKPAFLDALLGIEQNSHLWILSWLHKASRQVLQTVPARINQALPPFGVFALRSPVRPNPIGLSITELLRVDGGSLHVGRLDLINGTQVLDIKPYIENDCIFSPRTPYLKTESREKRYAFYARQARNHHQEECFHLAAAVRMAIIAEEYLGQLNNPGIVLYVEGSLCLADCLQGISRARFSNPEGFHFRYNPGLLQSVWKSEKGEIVIRSRLANWNIEHQSLSDHDVFEVTYLK